MVFHTNCSQDAVVGNAEGSLTYQIRKEILPFGWKPSKSLHIIKHQIVQLSGFKHLCATPSNS